MFLRGIREVASCVINGINIPYIYIYTVSFEAIDGRYLRLMLRASVYLSFDYFIYS